MARERQNRSANRKKSKVSKTGKPTSRTTRSAPSKPEREPWTPWGKWLKRRRQRRERKRLEREERRRKRRQARQKRWTRRRLITTRGVVFLGLLVLACGVAAIILLILGRPYPWETIGEVREVFTITQQIETKRQRWESLSINDYQVEIEYRDNQETWCGPALITIEDGEVIERPTPSDTHWFPPERCRNLLDELLPGASFDWLAQQARRFQPGITYLDIRFDETFGYPIHAEAGVYNEDNTEPGCCWMVTWRKFQPVYSEDDDN